MISRSGDGSELTPEQRLAFRVLEFNGTSVEAVVQKGETLLPTTIAKDPEVVALFQSVREKYSEWSFMCEKGALFNEKTAALLLSLGILTPEFFSVLLRKVRFEKYKKHLMKFLESIGRGQYLEDYFDEEIERDPHCHRTFVQEVLPRIADVFCAFKTDLRLDIENPEGKLRLLEDILDLLRKTDVSKVFKGWQDADAARVCDALEHVKSGLRATLKSNIVQDIAQDMVRLMHGEFPADEFSDFLKQIEDQFSEGAEDVEQGPPRFDPGHGWIDEEGDGEQDVA